LNVSVLRLGYRVSRDDRITTHAALVSRAFGCNRIYMTLVDDSILDSVESICERWGRNNDFKLEIIQDWKSLCKSWKKRKGLIVHLTMYGINIGKVNLNLDGNKDVLVIIGASKVPKEVYSYADYNIAIGNQPHSEISALAIFLDRLFEGKQLDCTFKDAKMIIRPSLYGKEVQRITDP
jgi:tRNA (cytidine56-2'-O)-methyltransferase